MVHGEHRVPLERMEWKAQKSRESVLLKLLHKRANVAETIYDMIGIRIVSERQCDVMQIVKMLYRSHVVSFPNAIPSRSRNSIMDQDVFRVKLDHIRGEALTGVITAEQMEKSLHELLVPPPVEEKENQHSGVEYRAIQLTCRQLIRTPRPLTILRKNMEKAAAEFTEENPVSTFLHETAQVLKNIARISGDEEFAFFPFEIQVMDKAAWEINSTGKASHGRYKKSQVRAARRRILNEILPLS